MKTLKLTDGLCTCEHCRRKGFEAQRRENEALRLRLGRVDDARLAERLRHLTLLSQGRVVGDPWLEALDAYSGRIVLARRALAEGGAPPDEELLREDLACREARDLYEGCLAGLVSQLRRHVGQSRRGIGHFLEAGRPGTRAARAFRLDDLSVLC